MSIQFEKGRGQGQISTQQTLEYGPVIRNLQMNKFVNHNDLTKVSRLCEKISLTVLPLLAQLQLEIS